MNLLDLMREPKIAKPVDRDGPVVQGPAQEHLCWRKGYRYVEIELHPDDEGHWMWSVSFSFAGWGSGYKVGRKWGRFAHNRDDALFYAVEELTERIDRCASTTEEAAALAWARGLK